VPPTEHGLSFLDAEYAVLARYRLGLPLLPGGGVCGRGARRGGRSVAWYDPGGEHAHSCVRNSGTWTRRHNHLRSQLAALLRWLGFEAQEEQVDSRLRHRPDVRARGFDIPLTHFEVYVPHPARHRTPAEHERWGRDPSAFIEGAWQHRLDTDYAGGPPADAPFALIPAAVSSYGAWHPEFARWWRAAVRAAAERAGPSASQPGLLWRSVGLLAVTLQRQTYQVLAGCAPARAAQEAGRLGRPLSEVPEYWRAAPEAALDWGAAEFDLPPPRRAEAREGADDLGASSRGHLRAAGLRL